MQVIRTLFSWSILLAIVSATTSTKNIFCYYGSWAVHRSGDGKFDIENIDPFLCSHAIYAYVGLNENGLTKIVDPYNDITRGGFERFVGLRKVNPKLKVLVSMGGWKGDADRYSRIIADPVRRARLINSIQDLLEAQRFDGFDFYWGNGSSHQNHDAYTTFIRELRIRLGTKTMLTVAVDADPALIGTTYNVRELVKYVDYVNLLTYDLNRNQNGRTGLKSPLHPNKRDSEPVYSIDNVVNAWIAAGAPSQKLLLGLSLYAQTFTLASTANNDLQAPISGPGRAGPYTKEPGLWSYAEVCMELGKGGWTIIYNTDYASVYAYKGDQWISYESPRTIRAKSEYAKQKKLAGLMLWSYDYEDVNYNCGSDQNPLISSIWSVL